MEQMKESQDTMNAMAFSFSSSLKAIGEGISQGLGLLAMALNPNVAYNQQAEQVYPSNLPNCPGTFQQQQHLFRSFNNAETLDNSPPLSPPCLQEFQFVHYNDQSTTQGTGRKGYDSNHDKDLP